MENPQSDVIEHEAACERVAAHFSQRWLCAYARGKLRNDPIYRAAYELLRSSPEPILDVGCGVGLLPFYLRERGCRERMLGLDVDARKIREAKRIGESCYQDVSFHEHNVQTAIPVFSGNVTLFDMLHYLPIAAQSSVLSRLAECVAAGGVLILRDCLNDCGPRFWMTYFMEKVAQVISWNLRTSLHFPSRARVNEAFGAAEFDRESRPWGTSLYNNHIFIFRRRSSVAVPASE